MDFDQTDTRYVEESLYKISLYIIIFHGHRASNIKNYHCKHNMNDVNHVLYKNAIFGITKKKQQLHRTRHKHLARFLISDFL